MEQEFKVKDGWVMIPIELLQDLQISAYAEKVVHDENFRNYKDLELWKEEHADLERICKRVDWFLHQIAK
jgi:hypothetical protein